MNIRKMKPPRTLITSDGLILVRQENRGEQDSVIVLNQVQSEILMQDLREAVTQLKNLEKKRR